METHIHLNLLMQIFLEIGFKFALHLNSNLAIDNIKLEESMKGKKNSDVLTCLFVLGHKRHPRL